jgi:ribose 5-phosphate isomerase A
MDSSLKRKRPQPAAIEIIRPLLESDTIIGVGTGSTANLLHRCPGALRGLFDGTVASSEASAERLRSHAFPSTT